MHSHCVWMHADFLLGLLGGGALTSREECVSLDSASLHGAPKYVTHTLSDCSTPWSFVFCLFRDSPVHLTAGSVLCKESCVSGIPRGILDFKQSFGS